MNTKQCCRCKEPFPVSAFYKNKARPDGLSQRCHECDKAAHREAYHKHKAADPEGHSKKRHAESIKHNYGITLEQYDAMLVAQQYGCALCGASSADQAKSRLHVDHDHKTGKVRGLLCTTCNQAIGCLRDDATLVRRAAEYLEKHLT